MATATHGSGDRNGNLATAVAALEMVTSDGALVSARRGDTDFDGMVVGLGSLGAVTSITLDVEPTYDVRQVVYETMSWATVADHFDDITSAGYSVSMFTGWEDGVEQIWVKTKLAAPRSSDALPGDLFGSLAATDDRHPVPAMSAENCTPQRDVPGRWSDRLAHFRAGFVPSNGDEIQSEFHVPRRHALDALDALCRLGARISPLLHVSEIRTVAADALWMSPQFERDTMSIHFTWKSDADAVNLILVDIERALSPFDARPHWGKVFGADVSTIIRSYPRAGGFIDLAHRLDPRRAFRNDWFDRVVEGSIAGQ